MQIYLYIFIQEDSMLSMANPAESACRVIYVRTTLIGAICEGQFCCLGISRKARVCVNVIRFLEAMLGENIF